MNAGGLLRTPRGEPRAAWRVAAFGIIVAASSVVVGGAVLQLASATPLARLARDVRLPLDEMATVLTLVFATWLTGRLIHREGWPTWAEVGLGRAAWRPGPLVGALASGVGVVLVPAALLLGVGAARFEPAIATDSPAFVLWSAVALLAPAAFAEELLFRGYVFSACRQGIGRAGAVAVTSAAFGLAHLFNPGPTVASIAGVMFAGVFLAVVRLATGSLVAASLAHFGVNFAQAAVLHASVSGLALQAPGYRYVAAGPAWLTGGAWGPEAGLVTVAGFAAASFLYLQWWRRAGNEAPAAARPTNGNPE